jgi:hypothetical protein
MARSATGEPTSSGSQPSAGDARVHKLESGSNPVGSPGEEGHSIDSANSYDSRSGAVDSVSKVLCKCWLLSVPTVAMLRCLAMLL